MVLQRATVAMASLFLITACERGGMITHHPVAAALPEPTATIGTSEDGARPALQALCDRLAHARETVMIGTQDGPEQTQFGAAISSTVAVEITENSYPRLTVRH